MSESYRINEKITAPFVLLISQDGKQIGEVSIEKARIIAEEEGLDLVELNPGGKPPVCKIIDYGKYKYHLSKKHQDAKKKQKQVVIKEIKLRPKIEEHDFEFKLKHAKEFIESDFKVKVTIQFRGREMAYSEFGMAVLRRFVEKMESIATPESAPQSQARFIFVILVPLKNNEIKTKNQKSSGEKI